MMRNVRARGTVAKSMLQGDVVRQPTHKSRWDERDAVLICYGDSVNKTQAHEPHAATEPPLYTLKQFLDTTPKAPLTRCIFAVLPLLVRRGICGDELRASQ